MFLKCFSQKLPLAIVYRHSFPIVRYFNGILFVFTLVFLKCAHYSTDFGTRMNYNHHWWWIFGSSTNIADSMWSLVVLLKQADFSGCNLRPTSQSVPLLYSASATCFKLLALLVVTTKYQKYSLFRRSA